MDEVGRLGGPPWRAGGRHVGRQAEMVQDPADHTRVLDERDGPATPKSDRRASSAYTAHLMDPDRDHAFFVAFSAASRLAFGYVWKRADFPWMGIWEENHSRTGAPWNGRTLARGMEFGVSAFPESRRAMVERGSLFDVPTYRWLPAKRRIEAEYCSPLAQTACPRRWTGPDEAPLRMASETPAACPTRRTKMSA